MYRSHTCGELRLKDVGKKVVLAGWVHHIRSFGNFIFIDLRDHYGTTQLVFLPEINEVLFEEAKKLGREFVIQVEGKVRERINKNPHLPTGDIEVEVISLRVLSAAQTPPFTIEIDTDGNEELRLRYRYLDLRRKPLHDAMVFRHEVALEIRNYLSNQGFIEIETPFLIRSTPEGARDFVVPSRLHPGHFYSLPQSPQQYKQILMIAGFDKYFQLVRCFRDEDLRADRQPEFTQIDCEMAFVDQEIVMQTFEQMIKHLFKRILNIDLEDFPRIPYEIAMRKYGTDKPDLRFDMQLIEITDVAKGQQFLIFDQADHIIGLVLQGQAQLPRKKIDQLNDWTKRPQVGGKGFVWIKWNEDGSFKCSVSSFSEEFIRTILEKISAKPGDIAFLFAGSYPDVFKVAGSLRLHLAQEFDLIPEKSYKGIWITDFPLLEWDEEEQRFVAMHHPFTSPRQEDEHLLEIDPARVKANSYDMVINGVEVGGGSIRIHDAALQERMFKALGLSKKDIEEQFGFFLEAFQYGVPPHGGIAFGFDRIISLMLNTPSIRDVIAFPKNNAGKELMSNAPSPISERQLKELHIAISNQKT
ncbi:MAG: aspartate--tRNA ligase [Bacteroidales bacterium]|nr:aspartate--tRNA ligase [Bacteroidales bacterium]